MDISDLNEDSKFLNSLEIQQRLTHAKNYNNWLFNQVKKYTNNRILEVGCALGTFTEKIINREFVCAIDIEEGYIRKITDIFKDKTSFEALNYDISSPEVRKLKQKKFDTIICFNVLEHIEKDSIALDNMYYLLQENGHLCLIVPAFQSIFGQMDKTDNHCRRYNKRALREKAEKAGFTVVNAKYINMFGFLGWWFNGKILKRRYIPFRQMLTYDKVVPLVSAIENMIDPPFGQSLVLISRKQKQ